MLPAHEVPSSTPFPPSSSSLTLDYIRDIENAHLHILEQGRAQTKNSYDSLRSILADRDSLATQVRTLQSQLSMLRSGTSLDRDRLLAENELLQTEIQRLRLSTTSLSNEKDQILSHYHRDKQRWNAFKKWWDDKVHEKQTKLGKKRRFNEDDRLLLHGLGLNAPLPTDPDIYRQASRPPASIVNVHSYTAPVATGELQVVSKASMLSLPTSHRRKGAHVATPLCPESEHQPLGATTRIHHWLQKITETPADMEEFGERSIRQHFLDLPHKEDSFSVAPEEEGVVRIMSGSTSCSLARSAIGGHQAKRRRVSLVLNDTQSPNFGRIHSYWGATPELEAAGASKRLNVSCEDECLAATQRFRFVSPRPHQIVVKAESDDETQRRVARRRPQTLHRSPSARILEHNEALCREEALRRRKADMEELKANPWKYRGRGRYASELRRKRAVARDYELIPELNGGTSYEHVDVVRDRRMRRQMHAHDCPCCKDYWDLVGPPATSTTTQEAVVSPHRLPHAGCTSGDVTLRDREAERARMIALDEEEMEQVRLADERRQRAGKHRAWGQPAPTPEGYWDISFPDTPRKKAINEGAEKQALEKECRIRQDERFRRRQSGEVGGSRARTPS